MIAEFTVENHLSFRDPVTLSFLASGKISEYRGDNVISQVRLPLLKTVVVYGANASGKSNLLTSLGWMRRFVINSSKEGQAGEPIGVKLFKLDIDCLEKPSVFEVVFYNDGIRYRYGFAVNATQVVREWLLKAEKVTEKELFIRMGDEIEVEAGFDEGVGLEEKTRPNALFLSVVANLNGKIAGSIIDWFLKMRFMHGLQERAYSSVSVGMLQDADQKDRLLDIIRRADLGIEDFQVNEEDVDRTRVLNLFSEEGRRIFSDLPARSLSLSTVHTRYKDGKPIDTVDMDLDGEESEGTRKFFRLIGPVLECLATGGVIVADELEAKLHPMLTRMIVRLFHSPATNPKNAQLLFATHDTNLLQHVSFRRDQIWFTEKTRQQATDLYSLAEIKLPKGTVRKDASYAKDYFRGRYGAIPYLGDFEALLKGGEVADGEAC